MMFEYKVTEDSREMSLDKTNLGVQKCWVKQNKKSDDKNMNGNVQR